MNQSFTYNKSSHGRFRGASKTSKNSRLCEPRGTFTAHGFEGTAKPFVQVFNILRPGAERCGERERALRPDRLEGARPYLPDKRVGSNAHVAHLKPARHRDCRCQADNSGGPPQFHLLWLEALGRIFAKE